MYCRRAGRAREKQRACVSARAQIDTPNPTLFTRRLSLSGLLALATTPLPAPAADSRTRTFTAPVSSLTTFQKAAIAAEFEKRCLAAFDGGVITAADAPAAVRLLLADAASGGVDGSAAQYELSRAANKGLSAYVAKLKAAKATIDAAARPGQAPVSWADITVLGARSALRKQFLDAKIARAASKGVEPNLGAIRSLGSEFPITLGRVDATAAGADVTLPPPTADAATVKSWFAALGQPPKGSNRPLLYARPAFILWSAASDDPTATEASFASADPEFRDAALKYTRSRATASRTEYEVDVADAVTRVASARAGAAFVEDAYLYPIQVEQVNIS